jgi:hypothetical protein
MDYSPYFGSFPDTFTARLKTRMSAAHAPHDNLPICGNFAVARSVMPGDIHPSSPANDARVERGCAPAKIRPSKKVGAGPSWT